MTLRRSRKTPLWTLSDLGAWTFAKRVATGVSDNRLTGYSAELAYYFFLSLFPSLLFLTTLLAFLPIQHRNHMLLSTLGHILPAQALSLVKGTFEGILHHHHTGLLSFSVLFALYSASNAITAVTSGLNQTYNVSENRPYWRVLLMSVLLALALALILTFGFAIFFFGPLAATNIAHHFGMQLLPVTLDLIRWPIALLAIILATALIYYFTPNVRQNWRWLTPGSVFAVMGWIATSLLFAFYVNNFGSYNKTYGSIGAVIVLLTWMYLGGLVLLIGGQINAVLKRSGEGVDKKTEKPTDERHPAGHQERRTGPRRTHQPSS